MDRSERFYKIDQMLRSRGTVTTEEFKRELEVSLATLKRDLEYMKSRHNAPIEWDRDAGGYRFVQAQPLAPKYELPGLWFNPREAQALLTMEHLLHTLEPGLLAGLVEPLKARLASLLSAGDHSIDEVRRRIRVITSGARRHEPKHFQVVASAVLGREKLHMTYWNRANDETTERDVSPQRMVHYRNNWYLDAWCHLRKDIRSFSLDAIRKVSVIEGKVKDVPDAELNAVLASGYGIFSGKKVQWATLRFTPERARWVSLEAWHSKQRSRFEKDGSYVIDVPFSSAKELVMDILKYGPDVDVVSPASLRAEVAARAAETAKKYR